MPFGGTGFLSGLFVGELLGGAFGGWGYGSWGGVGQRAGSAAGTTAARRRQRLRRRHGLRRRRLRRRAAAETSRPASATLQSMIRLNPRRDRGLLRSPRVGRMEWLALGVAVHLCKLLAVSRAWRNIIKAAYPDQPVPGRRCSAPTSRAQESTRSSLHEAATSSASTWRSTGSRDRPTRRSSRCSLLQTLFDMVHRELLHPLGGHAERPAGHRRAPQPEPAVARLRLGVPAPDRRTDPRSGCCSSSARRSSPGSRSASSSSGQRSHRDSRRSRPQYYLRHVVAWQLLDWTLRLATVFFFLNAFGIPATLHNALLVQVSQSLATIFPFSPGGIGTEQALLVYVFRNVTSRSVALSFSVGMRVTLIVVNASRRIQRHPADDGNAARCAARRRQIAQRRRAGEVSDGRSARAASGRRER